MLTCVKFNLIFNIPSWLKGKHKDDDEDDEGEDYAYLRWEYKESEDMWYDDEVKPHSSINNAKQAQFEDIHSWLEKQNSDNNITDEEDLHYACVDITNIDTTKFVQTSNNKFRNKEQNNFYNFEDEKEANDSFEKWEESCNGLDDDEETSYSSEIRRKSTSLFIKF